MNARWLTLMMLPALVACGDELPSPTLVQDLRVLAVRAEPPELLFDREQGFTTAGTRFEALVVDPRRGPVPYVWQLCPVESQQACADYDDWRGRENDDVGAMLDALRTQQRPGTAQVADRAAPLATVESFEMKLEASFFMHHLLQSGLGLGNGVWPSAVLTAGEGAERVQVQKRVTVNARDLSQWNVELSARFGMTICTEASAPAGCLLASPRTANRNPSVAQVLLARDEAGAGGFLPADPDGTWTINAGQKGRLRPVLPADAEETYQVIDADLQTARLQVVPRREEVVVSWFTTQGTFKEEKTTRQLTKDLDNVFTAPLLPGDVHLWLVLRDQRGGTGWTRIDLRVVP
jgi:hypothetical protein